MPTETPWFNPAWTMQSAGEISITLRTSSGSSALQRLVTYPPPDRLSSWDYFFFGAPPKCSLAERRTIHEKCPISLKGLLKSLCLMPCNGRGEPGAGAALRSARAERGAASPGPPGSRHGRCCRPGVRSRPGTPRPAHSRPPGPQRRTICSPCECALMT